MAYRFSAGALAFIALCTFGISVGGCSNGTLLRWDPETQSEKELRQRDQALRRTINEGAVAGGVVGGTIGAVVGGPGGAFKGAEIGRFLGAGAGSYVRELQSEYGTQEAVLNAILKDIETTSAELDEIINSMQAVLAERQQSLSAARDQAGELEVQRQHGERALMDMRAAVANAKELQSFFGDTRAILSEESPQGGATLSPRLGALAKRIRAMRAIADDLANAL